MSRQYHYLIAGFPDLLLEDNKLTISSSEFRESLVDNLHPNDLELIRLYYLQYDNKNLLSRLQNSESEIESDGNYSSDEIDAIILAAKDNALTNEFPDAPAYFEEFITAFRSDTPFDDAKAWDLQLSELYYQHICATDNVFVSDWFAFERDLNNIITASQCRKHGAEIESQLIGQSELTEKLLRSNARDFGIPSDFTLLDTILKATETDDLLELEKKIDQIKWSYLDEEVFFHYFSIEKIFSFIIKLSIIERWLQLDADTGKQLFTELLQSMETTYEFPEEFNLKK